MKKLLPIAIFICSICYFLSLTSCQKEFTPDGVDLTPPKDTAKVSSKNPVALSKAIKVWHGVRTQGAAPTPNASSPAIDPLANPTIRAIQGRYAIIKPEVTSGTIAGYYLAIPGTTEYFKIDYSKQRILERNIGPKKNDNIFGRRTGNADSSIVIVLPANINAPDTFCVTYCPYDSLGNVGQPVTTCIYVATLGAGANNGWLQNDFRMTATWQDSGIVGYRSNVDTNLYNNYRADGTGYSCNGNMLTSMFTGNSILVDDSLKQTSFNLRFAINGAFDIKNIGTYKNVDLATSTCTNFIFNYEPNNEVITGGYSFNDVNRELIFLYEFDDVGIPSVEFEIYDLTKISNNQFVISYILIGTEREFIRFER